MTRREALALTLSASAANLLAEPAINRRDEFISLTTRERLFIRTLTACAKPTSVALLIHGARVPGVPSFDLPVPNGSLAADLATPNRAVAMVDLRGFGYSTRPSSEGCVIMRSSEVVRDIDAAVDWLRHRFNVPRVALVGWATGGHWAGFYATLFPEKTSHVVMMQTLYGGSAEHSLLGHGSDMEDPARKGEFNWSKYAGYSFNSLPSPSGIWNRSIPLEDKAAWRDPALLRAYEEATAQSDPEGARQTPPVFRAPSGPMADSFYLAIGRRLWDASLISAPSLVVRSERDFWSRPEDAHTLYDHLAHAERRELLEIPNATHLVHLDRAERGRDQLLAALRRFLSNSPS